MNRILVVNINWIGDAIITTPAFRALKEKFPSAYVAVMAPERVRGVFANNPYIDEIIIFDEKTSQRSLLAKLRFVKLLKAKKFDTAFLIHRSFTRALICWLAGIKRRIGYRRLKTIGVINAAITPPAGNLHRQDYYLCLFEEMGIIINDKLPKLYTTEKQKEKYRWLIEEARKKYSYLIGINPSGNWHLKRWPAAYIAKLADRLTKETKCAIILVGASRDCSCAEEIANLMQEKPYNLCGKTDLPELAALIEEMDIFISADSGPAHLAAATGVHTLALFGPTSEKIARPIGKHVTVIRKHLDCPTPCYRLDCKNNVCMKAISVEDVLLEIQSILKHA
ncbi:MAG: lipopolysaccharide heptosyltransferase II [Candidatus Omnitrophota bacterium]